MRLRTKTRPRGGARRDILRENAYRASRPVKLWNVDCAGLVRHRADLFLGTAYLPAYRPVFARMGDWWGGAPTRHALACTLGIHEGVRYED